MGPRRSRWVTFLGCLNTLDNCSFSQEDQSMFPVLLFISYCFRRFVKHVSPVSWVVCSCTSQFHVYDDTVLSQFPMGPRRSCWVTFLGCLNTLDNCSFSQEDLSMFPVLLYQLLFQTVFAKHLVSLVTWGVWSCTSQFHVYDDTILSRFPMRPRRSQWVPFLGCLLLSITVLFLKKTSRCFQSCFINCCSRQFLLNIWCLSYLELFARVLPSFMSMMTQFYRGFQWDLVEVNEYPSLDVWTPSITTFFSQEDQSMFPILLSYQLLFQAFC